MQHIVLGAELSQAVIASTGPIIVLDEQGRTLGILRPAGTRSSLGMDESEILAEAKRRLNSNSRRYTTAEVLDHLKSIDRP